MESQRAVTIFDEVEKQLRFNLGRAKIEIAYQLVKTKPVTREG